MIEKPNAEPSEVTAQDGSVIMDGPDGVEVALTPDAAEETSERLHIASIEARGQQLERLQFPNKQV